MTRNQGIRPKLWRRPGWWIPVVMLCILLGALVGLVLGATLQAQGATMVPKQVYVISHDSDLLPNRVVLRYCADTKASLRTAHFVPSLFLKGRRAVFTCTYVLGSGAR